MTTGKKLCAFLIFTFIFLPLLAQAKQSDTLKKQILIDQKKAVVMKNMEFSKEEESFSGLFFTNFRKNCSRWTNGPPS